MNALKEVSKVWLVAKMVYTLFESILGNKLLEERLQKAAGKRHKKAHVAKPKEEPPKRKFDDIDMGFSNGPPMPQVSYERSRPQTPALTPSRDVNQPHTNGGPQLSATSPHITRHPSDTFVGAAASRGNTRPTTPFNPSFSFPGTPPDLFLVTRNSPNISQDLWQNFQPGQLFPAETNLSMNFPSVSPIQQHSMVDPQLSSQQQNAQMMGHSVTPGNMQNGMGNGMMNTSLAGQGNDANAWAQLDVMNQPQSDETWSNSSRGQVVPATLNVEDWYVNPSFFCHVLVRMLTDVSLGSTSLEFMEKLMA
jgi:hypothetical protein